jgi:hypothetical protein
MTKAAVRVLNRGLVVGLTLLGLSSGAGTGDTAPRPAARIPSATPVAMVATPGALLTVCRGNTLLRPICPRRVPAGLGRHLERLGYCYDRKGRDLLLHGHYRLLAGSRCVQAGWGFEASTALPGQIGSFRVSGWDGRTWVPLPSESLLFSPPLHIHVEIAASAVSPANLGWPTASASVAHKVSDALLDPTRRRATSLGWVRWHGRHGQLVLAPVFPFGGEWGGHLIFYFTTGGVHYAVTLHAWMPALRLSGRAQQVVRYQSGPALPHVIATLKAMVGAS